ncbi:MAG: DNA internalization-related competence protein ComEC/Rec2 [Bacillota bacterium]|nr:DNA internalization-related competence protein ComEC/Rec2 [Bacillota bacterium]
MSEFPEGPPEAYVEFWYIVSELPLVPFALAWVAGMAIARMVAGRPGAVARAAGTVVGGSGTVADGFATVAGWLLAAALLLAAAWWRELRERGKSPPPAPGVSARAGAAGAIPWEYAAGRLLLLVLAGLVGGSYYLGYRLSLRAAEEPLVGKPYTWRGTVIREPVVRDGRLELVLRGGPLAAGSGEAGCREAGSRGQGPQVGTAVLTVLARVGNWGSQMPPPRTGELVSVYGEVARPGPPRNPGEFDYAGWLRAQGVAAILYADGPGSVARCGAGGLGPVAKGAAWLRVRFLAAVRGHLPTRQGAVVEGMVLGLRSGLSPELEEAFRRSGLTHLLAVSGSNVALVAGVVRTLLGWAGVRAALVGAIASTWVFAAAASGGASVGRAALMATLMLAAKLAGRPAHPLNSLAAAVLFLTVLNPCAWEDPGFWLSVAATAGILGLSDSRPPPAADTPAAGPGRESGPGALLRRGARGAKQVLAVTCAAQAAVLPISLHYFQQACLVAPLSNLLVFPLVGAITVGGLLSAACAGLHPALGWSFRPLGLLVEVVIKLAGFWAAVPGAAVTLPAPRWPHLLLYYLFLGWWWGWLRWPVLPRRGPWTGPRLALAGLVVVVGTALVVVSAPPRHVLQVVFFSVGQGDAILLWRPGGPVMLVDCGPVRETYDAGADTLLPYLHRQGIRRVDLLVLTHDHGDHVGGAAAVLGGVRVRELWLGAGVDGRAWDGHARDGHATPGTVLRPAAGHRKVLAPGWEVEVLHPSPGTAATDSNDASLVLLVSYRGIRLLLAGDLEEEGEGLLVQAQAGRLPEVDLLKVPHHGGLASCGEHFLRLVKPRHAVVQVGPNPFGHPAPETLRRLERTGARVWRTDVHGAVLARTNGRRLSVACMIPGAR